MQLRLSSADQPVDWVVLVNAILGNFLAGLSTRIFMISLPTLADGLNSDIRGVAWALISFQVAGISLSLVFGRLGDIYGRKAIHGLGFIILTLGAFLCGVSQNVLQLIGFRFLQGVGGAMSQSAGRALAMDAVPPGQEGKVQGIMTSAFHSGFFVGPPLGGFIIDYMHWRGIFFLIAGIALIGVGLSVARYWRPGQPAPSTRRSPVDYKGAGMLIALTLLLTLLLDPKAADALGVGRQEIFILGFAAVAWVFIAHELKAPSPMLDLSLFRIRMFSYSVVSLLTLSITRGLVGYLMPFYLQGILNLSPSFIGVIFLAPPILTVSLSTLGGQITDRVGPRIPATIGVLASLVAMVIGVVLRIDSHWYLPTVMLGLTGLATAFFNSANQAAIIGSVPKNHRGVATGMVHTAFELGHMLGVSVGALLLALAFEYYSGVAGATPSVETPSAFVSSMNASYIAATALTLVALTTSVLRGSGKIQAAGA